MSFKAGDKVRIDHPNGSYGVITHVRDDGPFERDPQIYLTYHYGVDSRGAPITSNGVVSKRWIVPVTEAEFTAISRMRAWAPNKEQQ